MRVAVIGAGAAGLATASELLREGHAAVVFERSNRVGGLWVYREETETDPLGQCPRRRIHSSLYASLRTNLPRDLMAFDDYPFDTSGGGDDGWHRYPGHPRVLEYLERFGADKALLPHVRFEREVARVTPEDPGWSVDGERFEAVAVCNGHFSEPYVPPIPGLADFRGQVLHSHNYRRPDDFADRRVVVLGSSVSGADLARELHGVAREVYFSGRAFGSSHTGLDGVRPPPRARASRRQRRRTGERRAYRRHRRPGALHRLPLSLPIPRRRRDQGSQQPRPQPVPAARRH